MCSVYLFALIDRYGCRENSLRKLTLNKSFTMDQTDDLSRSILNLCSEFTKELYRKIEKFLLELTAISSHLSFNVFQCELRSEVQEYNSLPSLHIVFCIKYSYVGVYVSSILVTEGGFLFASYIYIYICKHIYTYIFRNPNCGLPAVHILLRLCAVKKYLQKE